LYHASKYNTISTSTLSKDDKCECIPSVMCNSHVTPRKYIWVRELYVVIKIMYMLIEYKTED
jgi:hypothetical protein